MARRTKPEAVALLLEHHGRTWADEAGFRVEDRPSAFARLLCHSLLLSARISSELSVRGTRALFDKGWTTPEKMLHTTWSERTRALNRAGYARFDEKTTRMLGDASTLVMDRWQGDLRRLRAEAGCNRESERALLKLHKGIGDVGADIFFREVQGVWPEVRPFLGDRAIGAAQRLGLGNESGRILARVKGTDSPKLTAALIRVDRDDGYGSILGG